MEIAIGSLGVSIAVVVGLTEAVKRAGLPSKFSALVSLAFGVASSFVFPAETMAITVFTGIVIGLSASGLYSGTKAVVKK